MTSPCVEMGVHYSIHNVPRILIYLYWRVRVIDATRDLDNTITSTPLACHCESVWYDLP